MKLNEMTKEELWERKENRIETIRELYLKHIRIERCNNRSDGFDNYQIKLVSSNNHEIMRVDVDGVLNVEKMDKMSLEEQIDYIGKEKIIKKIESLPNFSNYIASLISEKRLSFDEPSFDGNYEINHFSPASTHRILDDQREIYDYNGKKIKHSLTEGPYNYLINKTENKLKELGYKIPISNERLIKKLSEFYKKQNYEKYVKIIYTPTKSKKLLTTEKEIAKIKNKQYKLTEKLTKYWESQRNFCYVLNEFIDSKKEEFQQSELDKIFEENQEQLCEAYIECYNLELQKGRSR